MARVGLENCNKLCCEAALSGRRLAGRGSAASCAGLQQCAGGHFFGTFPSGMRVQETIHKGRAWPLFRAPMLQLEALWKGPATPFGCAYTCAIGDTVTQG